MFIPSSTKNKIPLNNIGIIEIHNLSYKIAFQISIGKSTFLSNSYSFGYSLQDTNLKFQLRHCETLGETTQISNEGIICGNLQRSIEWNLGEPLLMQDERNISTLVGLYSTSNSKSLVFTNIKFYLEWIEEIENG